MTTITKDPHSWFVAFDSSGKKQVVYNNERYLHNYPFGFEANFSDSPTPPINKVTLYNMTDAHRAFYAKKQKCYLAFNWGKDEKIISEGYITKIDTKQSDGVTDTQIITFTEGTDYSNIDARKLKITKKQKVNAYKKTRVTVNGKTVEKRVKTRVTKSKLVNKTYRAGTTYKAVISGIAGQAGIKIAKIELAENRVMKKAYTAKGRPLTLIKQLVKECKSKMTYVKGRLEIVDPRASKRTWYEIDDKDLIQPPSKNEASDDNENEDTWEITIPLIPEITVNTGIKMNSRFLKGKFYVKAGVHSSDGTNPTTQCSLVAI